MEDWLSKREQDLVDLTEKWKAGLFDAAKITAFLTARTTYETDNSTGNRIAKDEAKGEAVDAMREFGNTSIRFKKQMHDEDKLIYGIHLKDTTPTSQPGTEAENTRNHYEYLIRAINTARGDHSKPVDAYAGYATPGDGRREARFRRGICCP